MTTKNNPTTFLVHVDEKIAAWSELDEQHTSGDGTDLAGGVLAGDRELTAAIRSVLEEATPLEVTVAHPSVYYVFSEGRDTPADVAAAMIFVGAGRSILSESGWDILNAILDVDEDEVDGEDTEIIH